MLSAALSDSSVDSRHQFVVVIRIAGIRGSSLWDFRSTIEVAEATEPVDRLS